MPYLLQCRVIQRQGVVRDSRHLHLLQTLRHWGVRLSALLTLLMHPLLLRRHRVGTLLLLHIRLILERLLLVGGHVGSLWDAVALHVALRHGLRHGWGGGVRLFGRLDGVLVVDAI